MPQPPCPLEEGDRVDHRLFGLGTVSDAPVAQVSPDSKLPGGVRDAGWMVPVSWDDRERTAGRVANWALTKVSSPETRPFTYWDRQWQPLLKAWLAARRSYEEAVKSFRPPPADDDLARLKAVEDSAFSALQAFIAEEQAGRH